MKGTIVNFRSSPNNQTCNHMIVVVGSVENRKKAETLVGKAVVFKTSAGNEIKGKVAAAHGNKGAVRIIFERGMPGQSIGQHVELQ